VEVIPGITAGTAVPAMLGIPVTHREVAQGVTFVTGHTKDGAGPDWAALARTGTTLVIYMGRKRMPEIAAALMQAGMKPETPACAIENGTMSRQREIVSTLRELANAMAAKKIASPALIVIGEVVSLALKLNLEKQVRRAA
jgi:uroporphyrin-III C-methyltransferase